MTFNLKKDKKSGDVAFKKQNSKNFHFFPEKTGKKPGFFPSFKTAENFTSLFSTANDMWSPEPQNLMDVYQ